MSQYKNETRQALAELAAIKERFAPLFEQLPEIELHANDHMSTKAADLRKTLADVERMEAVLREQEEG